MELGDKGKGVVINPRYRRASVLRALVANMGGHARANGGGSDEPAEADSGGCEAGEEEDGKSAGCPAVAVERVYGGRPRSAGSAGAPAPAAATCGRNPG